MKEEKKIRKKIKIEDLLPRDPVRVDLDAILDYVQGKAVLVTGGGGSIGSEICRQLAGHGVGHLIIFDIYENNAYDLQQELKEKYPELNLVVLIGSVRNTSRINYVFETYHPDIVYHAAAHKHVPLMEDSPNEAVKNNVFGTWKTAMAAAQNHTKKFVMISTDKAVNPTNIMGASKRICEMIVQTFNRHYETEFVAVRFGNVLGSNGSVIPLFKKQIAAGGPVTVTHPDIIRYFMTIPEAVSLVLQAGAYAKGGEIFVLDMGEREGQLVTCGEAMEMITDADADAIWDEISSYFSNGDYYGGMEQLWWDVDSLCADYQTYGAEGRPKSGAFFSESPVSSGGGIAMIILLAAAFSAVIAGVSVMSMRKACKNVHPFTDGRAYLKENGCHLRTNQDTFANTHTTMVPIPRDDDNNHHHTGGFSGGGSFSSGGRSFGGGGGKF